MNALIARLLPLVFLVASASAAEPVAAAEPEPAAAVHAETAKYARAPLWPGTAPGSEDVTGPEAYNVGKNGGRLYWHISHPMLSAYFAAKPTGAAVLVIPGGGYKALYFDFAATFAYWFNSQGIDAFVLKHRLPDDPHRAAYAVPLQDAQRAMRLIRSGMFDKSAGHAIDPKRIGVFGLSAGGHLAAVLATYHDTKVYEPIDNADALSARPDFMVLAYPVLPARADEINNDLRPAMTQLYARFLAGAKDPSSLPPAFLMHGDKDTDVPYTDTTRFAEKLQRAGVPVEVHIFPGAKHAFGVDGKGEERVWPELCAAWLRVRGIVPGN